MTNIALVDDHLLFRKGLAAIINSFADYTVIMEASSGKEFTTLISPSNMPAIVILDITMPDMNGYETAHWIHNQYPEIKILALSMLDDERAIIKMLKNGAKGYILKDSDPRDLKEALDQLMQKGVYLNELMCNHLIDNINNHLHEDAQGFYRKKIALNDREIDFLQRICSDMSYKQIADDMYLSPRTIDGYRDALFQKLRVSSRIGLVLYAIRNDIAQI
ncbi:MAG: response regulator transcription factor [Sediminibacterium sp.]|jgi:two-component system, NarL family, invasion response regulator UvrY